jgi:hypothetical protein
MNEASKSSRLLRGGVMTDSTEGKARRLLADGQILLGFAGPKMEAAGSAPPDQSVPPPPVAAAFARQVEKEDKVDAWEAVIVMTVPAFIAFEFSGFWFIRCFELPPPSLDPIPGVLAFEIMAYGICGLGVLCSGACLVICALKICLSVVRQ